MLRRPRPKASSDFLCDPDKVNITIKCVSCKEDLWIQKILSRAGNRVGATETLPAQNGVPPFDRRVEKCIFCGERFYAKSKQGGQMYLLRDNNSQITRLI